MFRLMLMLVLFSSLFETISVQQGILFVMNWEVQSSPQVNIKTYFPVYKTHLQARARGGAVGSGTLQGIVFDSQWCR